jgi:hypothetical protein
MLRSWRAFYGRDRGNPILTMLPSPHFGDVLRWMWRLRRSRLAGHNTGAQQRPGLAAGATARVRCQDISGGQIRVAIERNEGEKRVAAFLAVMAILERRSAPGDSLV